MMTLHTVETEKYGDVRAVLLTDDPEYAPHFRLSTADADNLIGGESSAEKYRVMAIAAGMYGVPTRAVHISNRHPEYLGKTLILDNTNAASIYRLGVTIRDLAAVTPTPSLLLTADVHVYVLFVAIDT